MEQTGCTGFYLDTWKSIGLNTNAQHTFFSFKNLVLFSYHFKIMLYCMLVCQNPTKMYKLCGSKAKKIYILKNAYLCIHYTFRCLLFFKCQSHFTIKKTILKCISVNPRSPSILNWWVVVCKVRLSKRKGDVCR